MPSMSYCMFENTSSEIDQLIDRMNDALENGPRGVREFFDDMSDYEARAFSRLEEQIDDMKYLIRELSRMELSDVE